VRRIGLWALGAAGVGLLVWIVLSRDVTPKVPIEVSSSGGVGALQQLLVDYGFDVRATDTLPDPDEGTLIVVASTLGVSDENIHDFASDGGRIILVGREAGIPFGGIVDGSVRDGTLAQQECTIPALADTQRITSSANALDMEVGGRDLYCFAEDGIARVAQVQERSGVITWIGDVGLVQNSSIALEENAELFVRLLGDAETVIFADARLVSLPEQAEEPAQESGAGAPEAPDLFDLLPSWARLGLWQLVVALVLFVWWRSRRLGDPVVEDLPVEVPASEFVRASGRVFQRSGARGMSLAYIRRSFREDCGRSMGLSADAPADVWVRTVATRAAQEPSAVRHLLYGAKPANDGDLVDFTKKIDSLREECMR
jgi:Domain of unknown function (DUF4350)